MWNNFFLDVVILNLFFFNLIDNKNNKFFNKMESSFNFDMKKLEIKILSENCLFLKDQVK